jgi:hypothetical protein
MHHYLNPITAYSDLMMLHRVLVSQAMLHLVEILPLTAVGMYIHMFGV